MKEITFYPLNKDYAATIREQWKETGVPIGNDYYWIQYKDGSEIVFDQSYDEDKLPSLNINNILFISDWFSGEHGGYAEVYINTKLSHKAIQEIITSELYNDDGEPYFNKVNVSTNFPNREHFNFM